MKVCKLRISCSDKEYSFRKSNFVQATPYISNKDASNMVQRLYTTLEK